MRLVFLGDAPRGGPRSVGVAGGVVVTDYGLHTVTLARVAPAPAQQPPGNRVGKMGRVIPPPPIYSSIRSHGLVSFRDTPHANLCHNVGQAMGKGDNCGERMEIRRGQNVTGLASEVKVLRTRCLRGKRWAIVLRRTAGMCTAGSENHLGPSPHYS